MSLTAVNSKSDGISFDDTNKTRNSRAGVINLRKKLREDFPFHADTLLLCPSCETSDDSDDDKSFVVSYRAICFGNFEKIHHLQCLICSTLWFVCQDCKSQKSHYQTPTEAKRHIRLKHSAKSFGNGSVDEALSTNYYCDNDDSISFSNDNDTMPSVSEPAEFIDALFPYCSETQINYFRHNPAILSKDTAEGLRYLVSNAIHKNVGAECMDELTSDHIMFHSNIAFLSSRLTPIEQQCLINSYKHLERLFKKGVAIDESLVPTNKKTLNQRYLRGKHSFIQSIPRPSVGVVGTHAYVSLKHCIADLLGRHDFEIEALIDYEHDTVSYISQCKRAQFLISSIKKLANVDGCLKDPNIPRLILYLIEWSDDFDPAKCIKNKRGSAWMKSVTISPVHSSNQELNNTYPIAIGRKNDCHEGIEEEFKKELQELRSGNIQFRLGKYGVLVYVYVDIVASLQDQIERRSMNYIMLGSSTYSSRWGYSCNFTEIHEKLPACDICWEKLKTGRSSMEECAKCLRWDIEGTTFKTPKSYPAEIETGGILRTKQITYKSLNKAVDVTISNMSRRQKPWSKATGECFLSTEGINTELCDKIAKHSKKIRTHTIRIEREANRRRKPNAIRNETQPTSFSYPVLWNRGVPLCCHIDVPMHLLFLGIVKATTELVNSWLASKGWNLMVISRTNVTMDTIKNLNLTWCRTLSKWSKQGSRKLCTTGWVSENYLAIARLYVWYYSELITKVMPEDSRDYVETSMLLSSLRAMVSRVMTRTIVEGTIEDVGRHIKIFLQCFHMFTKSRKIDVEEDKLSSVAQVSGARKRKRSKPFTNHDQTKTNSNLEVGDVVTHENDHEKEAINKDVPDKEERAKKNVIPWISKYNYLCLLNIPDVMREFGPIRNYWEGGMFGEKILQSAKGTWYGFTDNWASNMLKCVIDAFSMKRTVFDLVLDGSKRHSDVTNDLYQEQLDDDDAGNYDRTCFQIYKSTEQVKKLQKTGIPISVIILENDMVIIATRDKEFISVHVQIGDQFISLLGHNYFTVMFVNIPQIALDKAKIKCYGLILPLYKVNDDSIDKWTIITSEWEDLGTDGKFTNPRVINCYYADKRSDESSTSVVTVSVSTDASVSLSE